MVALRKSRFIFALLFVFLINILVFQSGLYARFLYPRSYAGVLEQRCWLVKAVAKHKHGDLVACLGDSRIRHGLSAKLFNELAIKPGLTAVNLGVPASQPRTWCYLLEHVDPDCHTFKYIVIALSSYWDEDWPDNNEALQDAYVLLPILTLENSSDFLNTFGDGWTRLQAAIICFFKMYGYRADIAHFLVDPGARFGHYAYRKSNWQTNEYEAVETAQSLEGIKIVHGKVLGPVSEMVKMDLQKRLFRPTVNANFNSNYLRYWLNRIVSRYIGTQTKIFLVHIPDSPLPVQTEQPHIGRTIDTISRYANVVVEKESDFSSLSQPKYFCDGTHLNRAGQNLFTLRLAERILDLARASGKTSERL